jgi:hypothetical protein
MRWGMRKYYEYKIPIDAAINSAVTFSAFSAILNSAIDSDYPYKAYIKWGVAAGMTVGSFASTVLYYRGKQSNIVHVDSLNEAGQDLDKLSVRLSKKFRSRRDAILKINGLLNHILKNERPNELSKLLIELNELMLTHEQHLDMLKQTLSQLKPSIKPLMIASGISQGFGYSLLICSIYDLILGEVHLLDLPLIVVACALFLTGSAWNIYKEYHYEKSHKFIEHFGDISHQISQINIDFKACEEIIQNSISHLMNYFGSINIENKSPAEIYALYSPLIRSIQSSGRLGRGALKKSFLSNNSEELHRYLADLAHEYVSRGMYYRELSQDRPPDIIIDSASQQSQFQLLRESEHSLLPMSASIFSINNVDENSVLLNPERQREARSISKVIFLLYKIPEGGYPLLTWLTLIKLNLWLAGSAGAALGILFSGLKYARCQQFESVLHFSSNALSAVNASLHALNAETLLSTNEIDKKISEILTLYFSSDNLAALSKALRNSESLEDALRPRSHNRQQFWQEFMSGEFQLKNEQGTELEGIVPINPFN